MSTTKLAEAARAVIDRWDSPAWKDAPHTGEYIHALRQALASCEAAQAKPANAEREDIGWPGNPIYTSPQSSRHEAKPAPAGCELGCTTECKAKAHGCASECPALPWQPAPVAPAPAQAQQAATIKIGSYGKAFDLPSDRRAYTYRHQPNNATAWVLGDAASRTKAGGDLIDLGLSLLQKLESAGFGVFELPAIAASKGDSNAN